MNKLYYILIICLILVLCSCKDDCAKADKLRLQNKFEEAFELYQKAAKQGNGEAEYLLGMNPENLNDLFPFHAKNHLSFRGLFGHDEKYYYLCRCTTN